MFFALALFAGGFTRPTGDLGLQLCRRTDHVETRSPPYVKHSLAIVAGRLRGGPLQRPPADSYFFGFFTFGASNSTTSNVSFGFGRLNRALTAYRRWPWSSIVVGTDEVGVADARQRPGPSRGWLASAITATRFNWFWTTNSVLPLEQQAVAVRNAGRRAER